MLVLAEDGSIILPATVAGQIGRSLREDTVVDWVIGVFLR